MVWVDRFFHTISCYSFLNWTKKYNGNQQEDDRWATIFTVIPILLCQLVLLVVLYVVSKVGPATLAIIMAIGAEAMCSNFIWYDSIRKITTFNVLKRSQKNDNAEKQRAYTAGVFVCFSHMLIKAISYYTLLTVINYKYLIYTLFTASMLQAFSILFIAAIAKKTKATKGYGINIVNNVRFPQAFIGFILSCIIVFLCNDWLNGIILMLVVCGITFIAEKIIEHKHGGIFEEAICAVSEIVFSLFILSQIVLIAIL